MLRTIDHGFFTDMIGVLLDRKLFIRLATLSSCTYTKSSKYDQIYDTSSTDSTDSPEAIDWSI